MKFPWWYRLLSVDLVIAREMNEVASLKNLLEYNQHLVEEKDQEIQRLTNLMLTEHGVINEANLRPAQQGEQKQPINARYSWPKRQRELEKKDKALAQNLTSEVEQYWAGKNKIAEAEGLEPSQI